MNISYSRLIELLKLNLAENKPGEWAHQIMMPEGRINTPNFSNKPTSSAVLLALFEKKNELFFPVIRRPIYNGHHSGQIAFPGGKFEINDKTLINTALRESQEEIGVKSNEITVLGSLSQIYIPITNMLVLPVVGYLKHQPCFVLDTFEVDEIFTINVNELFIPSNKRIEKWNLRGSDVNIPFYSIQNQKIWGATAMILSEFEQLLLSCNYPSNTTL